MFEDVDSEKLRQRLYEEDHPKYVVDSLVSGQGAPEDYDRVDELLETASEAWEEQVAEQRTQKAFENLIEYAGELDLSHEAADVGRRTLEYLETDLYLSHQPNAIAGAAIHAASVFVNEKKSKSEVEDVADISNDTLNRVRSKVKDRIIEDDGRKLIEDL